MSTPSAKRPREDEDNDASSSSDDDFGPSLPTDAPKPKKRKKLPYEKLYVAALPASPRYSRSLMHKDALSFVMFTPHTDFLITSSVDGVVKFWKKTVDGIEFVKEFRAHNSEIVGVSVSADGRSFASAGADGTVKIFDVVTFDLLAMLSLEGGTPGCVCWCHGKGASLPLLAVGMRGSGEIRIYDGRGDNQTPVHVLKNLHRSPVVAMAFNNEWGCVVSGDEGGMLEYWSPSNNYEKPEGVWKMKSSTNLFEFKKAKSAPVSINMSPSGSQFATYSFPDRKIRVFDFATGKLYRTYDESITTISEMQQAGTALVKLEDVEFGRRLGMEKELEDPSIRAKVNVLFDESGHFIIYGSLLGTKVINTLTNRVVKVYGQDESFRALNLALYQGQPQQKKVVTVEMAASTNPLLAEAEARDAMLVSTGAGKQRFYMFTNETEISRSTRDVQNEKPRELGAKRRKDGDANEGDADDEDGGTGTGAVLHTTYGDITLRLFPSIAPKAVENFTTHARNGYYNNVLFHRVIRKFMIQTGDPLGDGTGGESIWGTPFEDECSDKVGHDKPYMLSMANAGPRTNGSQFFITTERTPWLDGKHTVFGRVTKGVDVVHKIENVRTHKERPEEDIRIVNISVL